MVKPNVSHCVNENEVHYNASIDYSKEYLTFDILSNGTIKWRTYVGEGYVEPATISYKLNDGEWTNITASNTGATINVSEGDKVMFKGNNVAYSNPQDYSSSNCFDNSTASFNVKGNIMSLIYGDEFKGKTTLESENTFCNLFGSGIRSAENLILPATTLSKYCYYSMFGSSLTTAPKLPATTLADGCYCEMFANCTRLTTAPELPATTLAEGCYNSMFQGCTSLTTAPELPATTLAYYCYYAMFLDCTSITQEASVPSSVIPVSSSYCELMYLYCPITTPNGNYDSKAYEYDDGGGGE